jgi:hypothetical protein
MVLGIAVLRIIMLGMMVLGKRGLFLILGLKENRNHR